MPSTVRSADRTLAIFEAFAAAGTHLQLGDVAEACDMPLSTCHSLVQTLIRRGYLYTLGRRKELYPTVKLLRLAQEIASRDPFLSRISEMLVGLSRASGETVTVGKRQNDAVLYLSAIDGTHSIRYAARAGEYRPLHSTALGKALLSALDDDALSTWMAAQTFRRITPRTVTTRKRLHAEISEGRARGWFVSAGEQSGDLTSVAVLVRRHPEPIALSLTGPSSRVAPSLDAYGRLLLDAKAAIEGFGEA